MSEPISDSNRLPDPQALLRWSLRGNACFSLCSGAAFVVLADSLTAAIGLSDSRIVTSVGVNLLGFACLLAFLASRSVLPLKAALLVVGLDLAWVVGTVSVVAAHLLNRTGTIGALAIAEVVLTFAALQYLGVRRARALAVAAA